MVARAAAVGVVAAEVPAMTLTGSIRFLVGTALVAAGATLCAPLATKLADATLVVPAAAPSSEGVAAAVPAGQPCPMVAATPPAPPTTPPAPPGGRLPTDWASAADPWAGSGPPATPDSAGGLQLDRCPPVPPAPLPPLPGEMSRACPAMGGAYRSTLDVPPPPLLDTERAPSPVAWAPPHAVAAPAAPAGAELTVPATYRVQDGDDLGAIAGRFYGHPAAASAIWAANRETISHPDLLPIGAELRLPPPWAARGRHQPAAGSIEPAAYARPGIAPADPQREAVTGPWLGPTAAVAPPPAVPAGTAVASVVVAPGETMASLARRIYGDPGMAGQIFAANQDRLRSPDLLVAGMELRLPRPLTAPRP